MIKKPINQKRVRVIKEHCQGNFKVGMEGLCYSNSGQAIRHQGQPSILE